MKPIKWRIIDRLKTPSLLQTTLLVTVVAFMYFFRAHPYLFRPQLFAEDGALWLAQGHNKNILALLQPVNGFLHFPERLYGFVVAHLPLQWAPLLFALTAWALFILLAYYLVSSRTKILSNSYERIFMVLAICLIANLQEFFFNFSNSIFLMGVIGVLIMVVTPSRHRVIGLGEKAFFFLSSLTLPFAWFFLPVALVERFKYKKRNDFYLYVSLFSSVLQIIYYLTSHVNRSPVTLMSLFSKYTLLEIYNQMVVPAVRFARIDTLVNDFSQHNYPVYFVFLSLFALIVAIVAVLRKSNRQVTYLFFFLAAMTFASVKSPTLNAPHAIDAIKTMAVVNGANRYFVYGILAINLAFVKATYIALAPHARYIFMVVFFAFGLVTSIHYGEFYIEKGFTDYTVQYNRDIELFNSGDIKTITIPVNPYPWHMTLNRR